VNLRAIDDRVWLETAMPPVFGKGYEYESQHPFSDRVLTFLLKEEVSAGPAKVLWQKTSPGTLKGDICLL